MRIFLVELLLLLARLALATLPELRLERCQAPGVRSSATNRSRSRDGSISLDTTELLWTATGGGYYTTIGIGTPPQLQTLLLDTGLSDLLILDPAACQVAEEPCAGGSFSYISSPTYATVPNSPTFNISFGDGSTASGPVQKDTVQLGSLSIDNVEFGLVTNTTSTTGLNIGILGLGYSSDELASPAYPNMLEVLKDTGVISSRLFSLYLNEYSTSGSLLFGGIDSSKYTGDLVTLDMFPVNGDSNIYQFITNITSVTVSNGRTGLPQTSIFNAATYSNDTTSPYAAAWPVSPLVGSGAWALPSDYYNKLLNSTFIYIDSNGLCSCDHRNDDSYFHIWFGGQTSIDVPVRDLLVPLFNQTSKQPYLYSDGTQTCALLVSGDDGSYGYHTLGESILRSMYLVFDLDNAQISIAQALINSTAPADVHAVAAGPSGVADAASRIQTAPPNTYSIATEASILASFSTSSVSSASTTALGGSPSGAPGGTRVSAAATGTTSAEATASTSSGAAAVVCPPGCEWAHGPLALVVAFAIGIGIALGS